ncbi:hypothetical protein [Enterobacter cloacae]|uniref:hypothetical protein n=1 Tax=Enterobacter cloacae TaxID=550 RepID=UPI002074C85D|nr:hypothetical protein [Enterobacter cloacae]MCM7399804.1 hypothetical protein [Enterobacter cloacae]
MNLTDFLLYQAESVKRANLPPVAKHSHEASDQKIRSTFQVGSTISLPNKLIPWEMSV